MKYLLGIDNGGTFSKAAIFDVDGNQISVASVPTVTLTPKPGYTEKEELGKAAGEYVRLFTPEQTASADMAPNL